MAEPRKAFVERLFAQRGALQAFFYRRLRIKSDAADLVQEVFLRMLRVTDTDAVRNPEAYLFTVAANLLSENAVKDRRQAEGASIDAANGPELVAQLMGLDAALDATRRVTRLHEVLKQLPPKCCAAVIMQYHYELSYEEIAARLEVSPRMVKKYLTQGLSHCRRRMARLR
jgi:RNA polymerase sigma factor (sigma-70 family)